MDQTTPSPRALPAVGRPSALRPLDGLVLFVACGLAAGLLEVGRESVPGHRPDQAALPDDAGTSSG